VIWDDEYTKNECIWGDKPSELAVITVDYLQEHELDKKYLNILDIGCGYGRDEIYLSKHLKCTILAIDNSEKAIHMAQNTISSLEIKNVDFKYCDFTELRIDKYDVVFVSNLYHILKKNDREKLRVKIMNLLKPEGLLFLNTLSINDPEEYGKGASLPDEPHSFQRKKYLHFSTRGELEKDFHFLSVNRLYEHRYDEYHVKGKAHHHISWILIGQNLDKL